MFIELIELNLFYEFEDEENSFVKNVFHKKLLYISRLKIKYGIYYTKIYNKKLYFKQTLSTKKCYFSFLSYFVLFLLIFA